MVDFFFNRDDLNGFNADKFVQDAWGSVANIWAQQAHAASPDLALQAEQDAVTKQQQQDQAAQQAAQQQQSDAATQAGLQQAMQEQYGQQQAQQWAAQAYGQAATAATGVTPLQTAPAASTTTDQSQPAQTAPDTSGMPSGASGNYVAAAWQAAQKYNLDPQTFVKQIQQESGFQPFNADGTPKTSPAGAIGIAQFMPGTAQGVGVNPADPLASLDAAAKMMAGYVQKYGGDMAKALAAYNAGPGNVDKFGGVPPFAETQNYVKTILGDAAGLGQQLATKAQQGLGAAAQGVQDAGAGAMRVVNAAVQNVASDLRPSQFGVGLSSAEAEAACGPVAAMAFARATGRNPTAEEAVQLAKQVGWTAASGMAGPASEVSLLKSMGVASHMEQGADVTKIAQDVQNGNPVIISTPGHYFVADDFDPNSGAFHVGTSGTDLRAGSAWMSLGQMQQVMGQAQATLYLDRQAGDGPSVATQMAQGGANPQQPLTMGAMQPGTPAAPATPDVGSTPSGFNPFRAVGDLAGGVGNAVGGAFSSLLGAGGGLLNRPQAGPNDNPGALPSPTTALDAANSLLDQADVASRSTPAGQQFANAQQTINDQGLPGQHLLSDIQSGGGQALSAAGQGDVLGTLGGAINVLSAAGQVLPGAGGAEGLIGETPLLYDAAGQAISSIPRRLPAEAEAGFAAGMPTGGRPLFGRGGVPGGPTGGLQAPPPATAAEDVEAALAQSLRNLGMSDEQIAGVVQSGGGSTADVAATLRPPTALPMAATDVPGLPAYRELEGPSGPQAGQQGLDLFGEGQYTHSGPPPIGTESIPGGPQAGQQGLDLFNEGQYTYSGPRPTGTEALAPGVQQGQRALPGMQAGSAPSNAQLFRSFHTGNVVSGIPTLTHVALNTILSPLWSFATRGAADIVGGATRGAIGPAEGFSRLQGSGIGVGAALADAGGSFMDALSTHFSDPNAIMNRTTGPVSGFFKAQGVFPALHSAFQSVAQQAVKNMEVGRLAGEEAAAQGLKGDEFLSFIRDAIQNPTGEIAQRAQGVADRASLRGELGTFGSTMQKVAQVPFVGNALFPVVRISANALTQGIERSPLGLLGTVFDVGRAQLAHAGPYAQTLEPVGGAVTPLTERLINNVAGTAITGFLASKALDGTITGNGPSDPKERASLTSQGWQANSIYIPGRGYVDYRVFGPLATDFMLAGNYADAVHDLQKHPVDPNPLKTAQDLAGQMTERVGGYLSDATGLRTLGEIYDALHGGANAGGVAAQAGAQFLGGFVPFSATVRNLASATDPFARDMTRGDLGEALQAGIPGLRQQLPQRLDEMGRPEANPQAGLGVVLPRTGQGTPDPVVSMLGRVGLSPPSSPKIIAVGQQQLALNEDEQRQYQQLRGVLLDQVMGPLATNPQFTQAPPIAQKQVLQRAMNQADQVAQRQLVATLDRATLVSRLGPGAKRQEPVAFRPPIPLNELQPVGAAAAPARQSLPLTNDFTDLDPIQQQEQRRRLLGY